MKKIKDFNSLLDKDIWKIFVIFLFCNPIIDLLTSVFINLFNVNITLGMIVRVIFLILCLYYFLFVSKTKYKKVSLMILGSIFLYLIIFITIVLMNKGFGSLFYESQNLFRTFFLPILFICIINMFIEKKNCINNKDLYKVFMIYILLIFIPNITNTGFDSYDITKTGMVGWFNSTNEIGAIITILLPFAISEILKYKNVFLKIVLFLIIVYSFFSIGTKAPIICMGITVLYFFLLEMKKLYKNKKYKRVGIITSACVLLIVGGLLVLPQTSFYKNIEVHLDYLKVDNVFEIFSDYHLIDHFIFSERLSFLSVTNNNYIKAPIVEKIFGIGYIENYGTDLVNTKMIEMDFFDIFYRHGIIGFIIYFIPFLYFFKSGIKKNPLYILGFIFSILLFLITGHVLIAPAVSIFVIVILLGLYRGEKYEKS